MIGSDGIHLQYIFVECGSFVDKQLQEIVWRRPSGQESELLVDGSNPGYDDPQANLYLIQ
jgi:hypothetical protein